MGCKIMSQQEASNKALLLTSFYIYRTIDHTDRQLRVVSLAGSGVWTLLFYDFS